MTHLIENPFLLVLAILTAVLGVGRLARILTYDSFPPSVWIRTTWARITRDGSWSLLARCFWCATPWIMLGCILWGVLTEFHWTWWAFWAWLGLSYLSSMVIARDDPND